MSNNSKQVSPDNSTEQLNSKMVKFNEEQNNATTSKYRWYEHPHIYIYTFLFVIIIIIYTFIY